MTRRAAVVKVQIARRDLGLDEDTYRSILERLTGRTSSSACSDAELGRVLDEFKAKGWKPKVIAGGKIRGRSGTVILDDPLSPFRAQPADHPSARKARALWISLWNLGEVRDSSEAALEAFARRQLKVEQLQWADQGLTYKLIEALKGMATRAGWSQTTYGNHPKPAIQLKRQLILAQHRRLCLDDPSDNPARYSEQELDRIIATLGRQIRALFPEAAG